MSLTKLSESPRFPARKIYDSADAAFQGSDANTSVIVTAPFHIQVDAVPAATTVQIEGRLTAEGAWAILNTLTDSAAQIITFDKPMNFVRATRSGVGAVKVYAQG